MDKLNTALNGGFPLELDDIRWMAVGLDRAFKGICDGFGNCILKGFETALVSGTTYSVAGGFVFWDGEVREMLATTVDMPGGPGLYCVTPYDTLDPSGVETFEDLTVQNAYQRRRLIVAFDTGSNGLNLVTGPRLRDRIQAISTIQVGVWHKVGDPGEPAFLNGYAGETGDNAVMFRVELNGVVRLRGKLIAAAVSGTNSPAFQLPASYRPPNGTRVAGLLNYPSLVSPVDGSNCRAAFISDAGNFVVHLPGGSGAVTDIFELSGFPTYVAYQ